MHKADVGWSGFFAASVTPFDSAGRIDWEAFDAVLELNLDQGADGLVINGSSGEWFSQTAEERKLVVERAVRTVRHRVPVIAGCTDLLTPVVVQLTDHARAVGADGVMVSPPPYVRPSPHDVVGFFGRLSGAVDVPIMIYNIPRRVGMNIDADLAHRLSDVPNVVALKNTTADAEFYDTLRRVAGELRVFGGQFMRNSDGLDAIRTIGGDGFIGGWGVDNEIIARFFKDVSAGELDKARELALREQKLEDSVVGAGGAPLYGASYQAQLKAVMNIAGMPAGWPRQPLGALTDELQLGKLRDCLKSQGWLG